MDFALETLAIDGNRNLEFVASYQTCPKPEGGRNLGSQGPKIGPFKSGARFGTWQGCSGSHISDQEANESSLVPGDNLFILHRHVYKACNLFFCPEHQSRILSPHTLH